MGDGTGNTRYSKIAKNTAMLYVRMFLLMLIGLFTSRVVLKELGVDDFGVYAAVGGLVTMFTIFTSAISSAISRFITFELGKGDGEKLKKVFSTSVIIQLCFGALILVLTATVGMWFLHHEMVIPDGRMDAAECVLECAALALVLNLLSVPYNAVIVAHEDMSAFAWISVMEAVLKLGVAFALMVSGFDKLKTYAVLMFAVAAIVRLTYGAFSHSHYEETRGRLVFDRSCLKEMGGFSGWVFFGLGATLFNSQGINILMNVFFGVGANAARGIATQVEGIVRQFVNSFTTALNPQITKSYASGEHSYCFDLVCKGARYSYLLVLIVALPVFVEADALLKLWLGSVPEGAVLFTRLTLIGILADLLGNSMAVLEMATGDIKRYYLIIGPVSMLVFLISWLLYAVGFPAFVSYIVYAVIYAALVAIKLAILHRQLDFPTGRYVRDVIYKVLPVTALSAAVCVLPYLLIGSGVLRTIVCILTAVVAVAGFSWCFAMTRSERDFIISKVDFRKWQR